MPKPQVVEVLGKKRHLAWPGPAPADPRDRTFAFKAPMLVGLRLKAVHDPRRSNPDSLPRVEDQAEIGSCVGNSSTSACEMRRRIVLLEKGVKPAELARHVPNLSRLFVYYASRVWIEGVRPDDDAGTFIRSAMRALRKFGTPVEDLWPYDTSKFATEPSSQAKEGALRNQLLSDHAVVGLNDMLYALQAGFPVVGGFTVPESMMSEETARTGVVKEFAAGEGNLGGHAVLFIGFDRRRRVFIAQNSWSEGWGDKGYLYLPFTYWQNGWLADCRAVKVLEDGR